MLRLLALFAGGDLLPVEPLLRLAGGGDLLSEEYLLRLGGGDRLSGLLGDFESDRARRGEKDCRLRGGLGEIAALAR